MKSSNILFLITVFLITAGACTEREFAPAQGSDVVQDFGDSLFLPFGAITHKASYGVDISSTIENTYYWKMRLSESGPSPEFKNWRLDLVENTGTGPVAELCQHSIARQDSIVTIATSCTVEPERNLDFRTQIDFDDFFTYEIKLTADFLSDSILSAEIIFPLQGTKSVISRSLMIERPHEFDGQVISIKTIQSRNQAVTEDGRPFKFEIEYSERFGL
ncbi:MAG: hypothetical protein ACO2ZZ_11540 [Cyclobacteriaceae bacterium]